MFLLFLMVACEGGKDDGGTSDGGTSDGGSSGPTWAGEVQPIIRDNCMSCHVSGGIAPFPLQTWEDSAPWAAAIVASVSAGTMPPWPPSADCNTYVGQRGLSDDEIATLAAWAEAGAPQGEGETTAETTEPIEDEADVELALPEPYTPVNSPDDYRCFLLDVDVPSDVYITRFAVDPDQDAIVHHVIAYLAEPSQIATYEALDAEDTTPGWECFGGPGGDEGLSWLGGWVPGSRGDAYPEGTGLKVPAGSKAVVQMHYFVGSAGPLEDQTVLRFWAEPSVEKEARLLKVLDPAWAAGGMPIPAGQSDVAFSVSIENPLEQSAQIWAAGPHMHLIGKSSTVTVSHADGTESCVVDIPEWDFHWQGNYFLEEPIEVGPDDVLNLSCTFDASDSSADLNWGEGSEDEMCLTLIYATLAD